MSSKTVLRGLTLLLVTYACFSVRLAAQDDTTSVAEAARRARQQKQEAAKPARVIDNDNLAPSATAASVSS
ncbi:MAG: hypothetical protein WBR26_12140, partial [Candidatus Acidiferrum sp.]